MVAKDQLSRKTKSLALSSGAGLVGITSVNDLSEHAESIYKILPTAQSVIVVAAKHSLGALSSSNTQVPQFDTIHTYNECAHAAHKASRYLESEGFSSVAVPAFIPIDMEEPKKGMRGEICWRRAGVRSGLGSYGENGLLVTKEFGAAIRLSGVVTSAELEVDPPLDEDVCDHCMRCIEVCPAKALSGAGKVNKMACGKVIFKYGFRFFQRFVQGLVETPTTEIQEIIDGHPLREMWQTFMTGNYYYCFRCQSQCASTQLPEQSQ